VQVFRDEGVSGAEGLQGRTGLAAALEAFSCVAWIDWLGISSCRSSCLLRSGDVAARCSRLRMAKPRSSWMTLAIRRDASSDRSSVALRCDRRSGDLGALRECSPVRGGLNSPRRRSLRHGGTAAFEQQHVAPTVVVLADAFASAEGAKAAAVA